MKRTPSAGTIEPLESRIAPARVIIVGLPDFQGNDTNYREANPQDNLFVDTQANPADNISAAVGPGNTVDNPATFPAPGEDPFSKNEAADTFYLRLSKGDVLQISGTDGISNYLEVKAGNVVAFFVDKNFNNEVEINELTGLSLGNGANVVLKSSIEGDVVSNLDERGTTSLADDTVSMTGLVSNLQGIASLTIGGGDVGRAIISGGAITNVDVKGNVGSILTGAAASGHRIDFFPGVAGGDGVLNVIQPVGKLGPSISKVVVNGISGYVIDEIDPANPAQPRYDALIEAGVGGNGAKGGSLTSIQVTSDIDGFTLKAGDGGDAVKPTSAGGAGGTITTVLIAGIADPTPNDLVKVLSGNGGRSDLGSGGVGGLVSNVFVGFQLLAGKPFNSDVLPSDNFVIASGAGGEGKTGGLGGSVVALKARYSTPDAAGDEFVVRGGVGGNNIVATGGSAGLGGSILNAEVRNSVLTPDSDLLLQGGNGGAALTFANGGGGGSITGATVLGSDFRIVAGDGSPGKTGGLAGSVKNVIIEQGETVLAHNAEISAGFGGDGTGGNGGNGGVITNVLFVNGDFSVLRVNQGTQANGGDSVGGKGGNGGTVTLLRITDFDSTGANGFQGDFTLRGGDGGKGEKGGGIGGSLLNTFFLAEDLTGNLLAGKGGNATMLGNGGAGGSVNGLSVTAEDSVGGVAATGTVAAGVGGNGAGKSGSGGKGGDIKSANVNSNGSVSLTAGNGGDGAMKAAGLGGSILSSGGFSSTGTGLLRGGDGGVGGIGAANGGSIQGISADKQAGLFVKGQLTVRAGDGTHGGAGGSIKFLGYGSAETDLAPTPIGDIRIQAGNGSAEGTKAGAGGSLFDIVGAVASTTDPALPNPPTFTTTIVAGNGGGLPNAKAVGAGGSINGLILELGGNVGGVLTITAGDGGSSDVASTGGKGGAVAAVSVSNLNPGTIFRSVAAGDGGTGLKVGGLGGTVNDLKIANLDLGARSGQTYGYTTMGGLFAGVGGAAVGVGGKAGLAGNVTNIVAQSIAAIVAGKGALPGLVEKVDNITIGIYTARTLDIVTDLLDVSQGDLDRTETTGDPKYRAYIAARFATNNLVGAVMDPTRMDGNKFAFTDANNNGKIDAGDTVIDGLIAAKVLVQAHLNFVPEAFYNGTVLFDHDNTFTRFP